MTDFTESARPANAVIRSARERAGITPEEVAIAADLSIHEYEDLEDYPDEAIDVVCIAQLKAVCARLSLDICELYGVDRCSNQAPIDIIHTAVEQHGASIMHVANAVGIEESEIVRVCKDAREIGSWVFIAVAAIAHELRLEVADLLLVAKTHE